MTPEAYMRQLIASQGQGLSPGAQPPGQAAAPPPQFQGRPQQSPGISPLTALGAAARGASFLGNNNLAGSSSGTLGQIGGDVGSALSIYNGLRSGKPVGEAGAALSAAKLYGNLSGTEMPSWLGPAGEALGIYSGIKQGTPAGYAGAALNAYQLYGAAQAAGLVGGGAAAGGAGAGAAAGAGAGAAGAGALASGLGIAALPVIWGLENPQVTTMDSSYWNRINQGLQAPKGSQDYTNAATEMRARYLQDPNHVSGYQNFIDPSTLQLMQQEGLTGAYDPHSDINFGGRGAENTTSLKAAEGGHMKSKLDHIYRDSYADRVHHFASGSDGGVSGYYSNNWTNYYNNNANQGVGAPGTNPLTQQPMIDPMTGQPYQTTQGQISGEPYPAPGQPGYTPMPDGGGMTDQNGNPIYPNSGSGSDGSSGLGSVLGGLGSWFKGLTSGQQAALLGGLVGGIGSLQNNGRNITQQYNPSPPTQFSNTGPPGTAQNASTSNMYGNFTTQPRQQINPNIANYATYGQGPAANFFGPAPQAAAPPQPAPQAPIPPGLLAMLNGGHMAQGGGVKHFAWGGLGGPVNYGPMPQMPAIGGPYHQPPGGMPPPGAAPSVGSMLGRLGAQPLSGNAVPAPMGGTGPVSPFGPPPGMSPFRGGMPMPGFQTPSPMSQPMPHGWDFNSPQRTPPEADPRSPLRGGLQMPNQMTGNMGMPTGMNPGWMAMSHGGGKPSGLLDGPGDGTSDSIVPAALSAGEYVVPAHVVSALGNGDNKSGARKLDELQRNVRTTVGKAMAQNKHPTGKNRAKKPEEYMG